MADLGYISRRHGIRRGNKSTQVGSPHFIRTQSVPLGFIMWGERTGLFCKYTYRNDKQAVFWGISNCQFLGSAVYDRALQLVYDKLTEHLQPNTQFKAIK